MRGSELSGSSRISYCFDLIVFKGIFNNVYFSREMNQVTLHVLKRPESISIWFLKTLFISFKNEMDQVHKIYFCVWFCSLNSTNSSVKAFTVCVAFRDKSLFC